MGARSTAGGVGGVLGARVGGEVGEEVSGNVGAKVVGGVGEEVSGWRKSSEMLLFFLVGLSVTRLSKS